ncbi:MAG: hypothetical protein GX491_12860 [Chloroflexi bacterium]|nr:hypothetical protein [Chloroflexota bacterium]
MARQQQNSRPKKRMDDRERTLRRNQIIFGILSGIIILSMVLSLMINI